MKPDDSETSDDFSRLDEAANNLANRFTPGPTEDLARRTAGALRTSLRRRTLMIRSFIAAAAAIVLITLSLTFWPFIHAGPLAMADVAQNMDQAKSMTAMVDSHLGDPTKPESIKIFVKGARTRIESGTGAKRSISITDSTTGDQLQYSPTQRRGSLMKLTKSSMGDLYGLLQDLVHTASQPLGDKSIDGQQLVGFGGKVKMFTPKGPATEIPGEIWVDPKTQLPVLVNLMDPQSNQLILSFHEIKFDVPVDEALLDMNPPKGYQISDLGGLTAEQLNAAPTTQEAESLTLRPLGGIGSIDFGATPAQIIGLLGPPEEQPKGEMRYPSKGLRLFVESGRGLYAIWATAARGVAWNSHDFPGTTDKGITLASTEQQVEAAYGPPDQPFDPKTGAMEYGQFGMTITIDPKGVRAIWLDATSKPAAKAP